MEVRTLKIIMYVLFCIGLGFTIASYLMRAQRMVAAGFVVVGAILVFIFYGLRWFFYSEPKWQSKAWPPQINTCPDFLTVINLNGKMVCVDTLGVSTNTGSGGLKRWTYGNIVPPNVDPSEYFDPSTKEKDEMKVQAEWCKKCLELGLTWEGICNGDGCYKYTRYKAVGADGEVTCESNLPKEEEPEEEMPEVDPLDAQCKEKGYLPGTA